MQRLMPHQPQPHTDHRKPRTPPPLNFPRLARTCMRCEAFSVSSGRVSMSGWGLKFCLSVPHLCRAAGRAGTVDSSGACKMTVAPQPCTMGQGVWLAECFGWLRVGAGSGGTWIVGHVAAWHSTQPQAPNINPAPCTARALRAVGSLVHCSLGSLTSAQSHPQSVSTPTGWLGQ